MKRFFLIILTLFTTFFPVIVFADDTANVSNCSGSSYKYFVCQNSSSKQCYSFPKEVLQNAGIPSPANYCDKAKNDLLGCNVGGSIPYACIKSPTQDSYGCCIASSRDKIEVCKELSNNFYYEVCSLGDLSGSTNMLFASVVTGLSMTASRNSCAYTEGCPQYTGSPIPRTTDIASDLKLADPPIPEIRIPFFNPSPKIVSSTDADGNVYLSMPWIGEYITAIYKFAMIIGSIIAVVMVIVQGARVVVSAGGEEKAAGYKRIGQIVIGLVILWGSYAILYTINPRLVAFDALRVKYIERQEIIVSPATEPITSGPSTPGTGSNNVPYFAQWEGPWAGKKPGDPEWPYANAKTTCTTIHQRGCGSTSLAMVLAFYGKNITPLDTAKWALGCTGAWQPNKTNGKNSADFTKQWTGLKATILWKNDKNKVIDLVKQGKPIIYNGSPAVGSNKSGSEKSYPGHYVVLTGLNGNTFSVNDPGANPDRRIVTMTISQMLQNYNVAVYVDRQ